MIAIIDENSWAVVDVVENSGKLFSVVCGEVDSVTCSELELGGGWVLLGISGDFSLLSFAWNPSSELTSGAGGWVETAVEIRISNSDGVEEVEMSGVVKGFSE